jgi:hypothetical protein
MYATDTLLLWSTEGDAVRVNPWAVAALVAIIIILMYLRRRWR